MSDANAGEARYTARDYAVLANAYLLRSYDHIKRLRETRDERLSALAHACYRQSATLFLMAAARFHDVPVPPPSDRLPSVDDLLPLLKGRLRFEAEAALRTASAALTRHYWRDFAEALRQRFERAEPALFIDPDLALVDLAPLSASGDADEA
jgi:hypothetical protein